MENTRRLTICCHIVNFCAVVFLSSCGTYDPVAPALELYEIENEDVPKETFVLFAKRHARSPEYRLGHYVKFKDAVGKTWLVHISGEKPRYWGVYRIHEGQVQKASLSLVRDYTDISYDEYNKILYSDLTINRED